MSPINKETCSYCFLDLDVDHHRRKLATGAAFVDATDSRYGFSSKDLRALGGSELARIHDFIATDHEWSGKSIEIRPPSAGNRVVLRLHWDVAPLACENFATLCRNGSTKPPPIGESGKPLTYRNSTIHRVIPSFIMQGGDFVFGNGSGGESIYNGKKFKDERAGLLKKHDRKGILSMGNSGKNSNTSQFFITFQAAPQCDGKHVVFGEVVSGVEVLDFVESFGTTQGEPTVPIEITDCGIFTPLQTPGAGYWYDQPDGESFSGLSPVFMTRPRVAVVAPTQTAVERFQTALHNHAVVVDGVCSSDNNTEAPERITELLEKFAVDVVVVAPACRDWVESMTLPESYDKFSRDQVILEAKPINALQVVWTQSWLHQRRGFPLDGAPSS